jgi:hypothetical protein
MSLQSTPQQILEQVVLAVPAALVIQRHQEQVGLVQPVQDSLA